MPRILLSIGGLCLTILLAGSALASPIVSDPLVRVSGPSPFVDCAPADLDRFLPQGEVEPYVTVNPADPANVVGAWMQDRFRGVVAGVSFDGGATWREVVVPHLTRCSGGRYDYAFDPWLSFGPDGDLYLSASVFDDSGSGAIVASKSTDGGLIWSAPRIITAESDESTENHGDSITADIRDSALVYAVWSHFPPPEDQTAPLAETWFARSTDGGDTWHEPRPVFDPGPNKLTTGNKIVELPGGMLLDAFTLVETGPEGIHATVAVIRARNQGRRWGSSPIVVNRLESVGTTDPEIGDGVVSGKLLTDIAVDPRSKTVYLVWQDARFSGGLADGIALSTSRNGGRTWSTPVKVNATPTDIPIGNQQAFTPSVEVAADGTVAVSYSDFRYNDSGSALLTDRWLTICYPALGRSCLSSKAFNEEVRLTDHSFDLRQAPVLQGGFGGLFLGDYMGLASSGEDFIGLFSSPHDSDQASVFARRIHA
jgi:hypothetical protein